jgi:hypothetical protein
MRVGQAVEHLTGGPGAARVSAILGTPLSSEDQVGLGHGDLARLLGDAVSHRSWPFPLALSWL